MNLRSRILLFQLLVVIAIVATGVTVWVAISSTSYYVRRVELAQRTLAGLTELSLHAYRHSEQIAEVLLVGAEQKPELAGARSDVETAMLQLARLVDDELDLIDDPVEREQELAELQKLTRLRDLFLEMDRTGAILIRIDEDGRHEQALALYRSQIEGGIEPKFETLLLGLIEEEREQVRDAETGAEALAERLTIGTVASAVLLLGASILSGRMLARSVAQPVAALAQGAAAIRRGELDHRIAYRSDDELGQLARQFDALAAELSTSRDQTRAARRDLEAQVAQRTEQLAGANQRLIDLDKVRLRFLADIGHELRTPLTVMRGEAEVTLRSRSTDIASYRETLQRVVGQAGEMGRLVEDLSFLARSEADQVRFERRRIGLGPLLDEARKEAVTLGRQRDVRIVGDLAETTAQLDADPRRLKQAIVILLDNAIKHSRDQGEVRLAASAADGRAEITVGDRGSGIPAEDLPYVFDRFYRGKEARGGGSGLGLAIARWIVEKHGGKIAIDSEPGLGTTARLELPCVIGAT